MDIDLTFEDESTSIELSAVPTGDDVIEYANAAELYATSSGQSAAAAELSETNAAASAVLAATFEPALYVLKSDVVGSIGNINSPLLDIPLNNSLAMKQGVGSVTFARSTTATYIDRYGVLQTASIDEPRFEKEGLLIEGASTNNFTYSNDVASWSGSGDETITSNDANFLDGTTSMDKVTVGTNGTTPANATTLVEGANTISVAIRKGATASHLRIRIALASGSVSTWFNLQTYAFGTKNTGFSDEKILFEDDEFLIISVLYTCEAINAGSRLIGFSGVVSNASTAPDTGETYHIGRVQVEELPFASSYIPTTTTAVTRAADDCSVTSNGNIPYPTDAHTISVDFNTYVGVLSSNRNVFNIVGFSFELLRVADITSNIETLYSGGARTIEAALTDNDMRRIIYNVDGTGSQTYYKDGVLVGSYSDTPASTAVPTEILLGVGTSAGKELYGHIKNFRIWDKALTPTEAAIA